MTEGGSMVAADASGASAYAWLLIALPLLGAAILLLGGRRTDRFGALLGTGMSWASFLVGLVVMLQLVGLAPDERAMNLTLWNWIPAGAFQLDAGLLIDPLSMCFVMLITFVGWEGVGLASYLLIGFWNWNPAYATAANKAFFVNRVGDLGLAIAIMLMFVTFGGVDYETVDAGVATANQGVLTAMGLLLLLGACGKSAQFPLQSWLGDAMAGPTPVSALIHAATMVTAGVYLIVRSAF